ncbi:hypothetical protein ACFZC3_15345 [Streptomyces sp. NPDC007903]|uniref:hypothetical protein n=1 Tax=Streptomyces sp. NPDC007903 TaxID=3364786 RepID=UPI0036ECCE66
MNHRPYPDIDRALNQWHRQRHTRGPLRAWVDVHIPGLPDWQKSRIAELAAGGRLSGLVDPVALLAFGQGLAGARAAALEQAEVSIRASVLLGVQPRRTGRAAIREEILAEALKEGHHVHVATGDGMRCAGGGPECSMPRVKSTGMVDVEVTGE